MSRVTHLVRADFVRGARTWLIASAMIASIFLAAAVVIARQTGSAARADARASAFFNNGKRCVGFIAYTAVRLTRVRVSAWPTDTWNGPYGDYPRHELRPGGQDGPSGRWESQGGDFRGCHNEVTFEYTWESHGHPFKATVEFSITKPWNGTRSHRCQSPAEHVSGLRCELKDVFDKNEYVAVHWNLVKNR